VYKGRKRKEKKKKKKINKKKKEKKKKSREVTSATRDAVFVQSVLLRICYDIAC